MTSVQSSANFIPTWRLGGFIGDEKTLSRSIHGMFVPSTRENILALTVRPYSSPPTRSHRQKTQRCGDLGERDRELDRKLIGIG